MKFNFTLWLMVYCLWIFSTEAKGSIASEQRYLRDRVTIITSTHPIPGNPSTEMLERTQKQILEHIPALKLCRQIIVFDGIKEDLSYISRRLSPIDLAQHSIQELVQNRYEEFKNNVLHLIARNPDFANVTVHFCSRHLNLAGAIMEALQTVETPYLFIHQHDIEPVRFVDAFNIIRTIERNSNIKLVRLNTLGNHVNDWDSLLDQNIKGKSYVPLLRTNLWSDQDHFTSLEYYQNTVMPSMYPFCCMEWILMPQEKEAIAKDITNHNIYGTYVYGKPNDPPIIRHWDGSRSYGTTWGY